MLKTNESALANLDEDEEEARRIAELGKPRLGENHTLEILIEESYEFKVSLEKFNQNYVAPTYIF